MTRTACFVFILLGSLTFFSCKKEADIEVPTPPPTPVPILRIDPRFQPYIDNFIKAGRQRGVNLSINNLTARLVDEFSRNEAIGQGFCGYGWWDYGGTGLPRVEIRNEGNCWTELNDLEKENFMFHELGHALLSRPHTNGRLFRNSAPQSVMCSTVCSNFSVFFRDGLLREYYLNELFDQSTPRPDFIEKSEVAQTIFETNFENGLGDWQLFSQSDTSNTVFLDSLNGVDSTSALAITVAPDATADIIALQRFEIADFQECSNIKLTVNARAENFVEGRFQMGVSLRERDEMGNLQRFFFDSRTLTAFSARPSYSKDLELQIFCLPDDTEVITLSFFLESDAPATFYIDDIRMDILE
ncbi:MAG: hypothetical protein AAF960_16340 [Bacteroidota bacterium]